MRQLRRRHSARPIARTPFLMGYRNDHNFGFAGQVENVERESLKYELVCSEVGQWILRRSFDDSGDGIVNGVGECGRA